MKIEEEKAKAYDEAIKKAESLYKIAEPMSGCNVIIEILFPELAESEDEKIRKELIVYFQDLRNGGSFGDITNDDIIAWLEKQGEHANFRNKIQVGDRVTRNEAGVLVNLSQLKRVAKPSENHVDKVEPKFHEGDWVVYKNDICQIVKREEGCNKLVTVFGIEKELVNERNLSTARFWTIQDAKDGDVLATEGFVFIFKKIREDKGIGYYCANENELHEGDDTTFHIAAPNSLMGSVNNGFTHYAPATKEQRTELFLKMHEAGYEFDFDKLELKKIELNSAWSEEDKDFMYDTLSNLTELKDRYGEEYGNVGKCIDWLKSLKPQNI